MAFPNTTLELAIRVDDKPGHKTASTGPDGIAAGLHGEAPGEARYAPSSAADAVRAMFYARTGSTYKCKFCPSTFTCAQSLGGHQKAHREQRTLANNPRPAAWFPVRYMPYTSDFRRTCLPVLPASNDGNHHSARSVPWQTGTSSSSSLGTARAQPSPVAALTGYRWTGDGGDLGRQQHSQSVREVKNQEETTDNGIDLTLKL